jgi:DNA topoisomerase IA
MAVTSKITILLDEFTSIALAVVVDRWKEIEISEPQPYWELQTLYRN